MAFCLLTETGKYHLSYYLSCMLKVASVLTNDYLSMLSRSIVSHSFQKINDDILLVFHSLQQSVLDTWTNSSCF